MAEYICREAIIKDLEKEIESGDAALDEDVWINKGLRIAIRDIKDLKTANVQPVAEYNKWINAKEQKPEAYEDVLVLFEYYFCGGHTTKLKIGTAYYDGDKWLGNDLYVLPKTNVLYWQPKTAESGD